MANAFVYRLGPVEFSLPEGLPTELERGTRFNIDKAEPLEGEGIPVFRGTVDNEMSLRGVVFPGFSGHQQSVQRLRDAGAAGKSLLLVDGDGTLYGSWFIRSVNERQSYFMAGGKPRRVEWDISLVFDPQLALVAL